MRPNRDNLHSAVFMDIRGMEVVLISVSLVLIMQSDCMYFTVLFRPWHHLRHTLQSFQSPLQLRNNSHPAVCFFSVSLWAYAAAVSVQVPRAALWNSRPPRKDQTLERHGVLPTEEGQSHDWRGETVLCSLYHFHLNEGTIILSVWNVFLYHYQRFNRF